MRSVQLIIGGSPAPWGLTGVSLHDAGSLSFTNTANSSLIWPAGGLSSGRLDIALSGVPAGALIDGVECAEFVELPPVADSDDSFVDHVVLMTNDLDRTCSSVAGVTGCPLKRVREVGEIRQGFHRIGEGGVIIEVVERADVSATELWGFVLATQSFDEIIANAGDLVTEPKQAVQPGRLISTVKPSAGLGVPVALMTV